jgi:hypothetical protein
MKSIRVFILLLSFVLSASVSRSQYVQPERNDTVKLFAKTPFDVVQAKTALAKGTGTIKGVAFIRRKPNGTIALAGYRINASKITILLFPVTPYLLEYLDVKKKERPEKLKFAYIDPKAWSYRLEAITNNDGEFTFPEMKPGKYYLEGVLPYSASGSYDVYTGSGYGNYGGRVDYYESKGYTNTKYHKFNQFVEIKTEGEVLEIKL